jgi:hypothetical protein
MIYVIELEGGHYYVGYSEKNDDTRIKQHFSGIGSEWCKKHQPLNVVHIEDGSVEDENRLTLELMYKFGYNNVRGGKWTATHDYKAPPTELVNTVFNNKQSVMCNKCKRTGHVHTKCIWNVDTDGDTIMH